MHHTQEKLLALAREGALVGLTLRELGARIGEPSAQKVKHHLTALERRGLVEIDKATKSVRAVTPASVAKKAKSPSAVLSPLVAVPIVGTANCGPATIFANENIEGYLRVSDRILKKRRNIFAIRAQGISMNRAQIDGHTIEDGDYLIIDADDRSPRNGDIVLSVIDEMANIKKFLWDEERGQIVLVSESTKDIPPIFIHEDDSFMVNGKVVQVIKRPRLPLGATRAAPARRASASRRRAVR